MTTRWMIALTGGMALAGAASAQAPGHGGGVGWSGSHGGVSWDGGHAYGGGAYAGYPAPAPVVAPARAAGHATRQSDRSDPYAAPAPARHHGRPPQR